MNSVINLSTLRKLVQLSAFIFLVYGSSVVGFYAADKLSNAFPVLACAYDAETADYCALIPLQHQMDHRVAPVLAAGGAVITAIMPTLITLLTFMLFFVFLNKAFCGWICPLGFFQELVNMVGQKLGLQRDTSLSDRTVDRIRPWKWLLLVLLVFTFPLLTGFGITGHELGSPFCSICPSRILTTLATGNTSQLVVDTTNDGYMIISLIATFLFGLMIALALTVRQPFCRICPMLAMHAVFRKIGFVRLVKNSKPRCDKCGLCAKACPMDIREIHTEMDKKDVLFADCTLCGRCVEFCPDKDVLQMKYTALPIFRADPDYFKARKKAQDRWEKSTFRRWFGKSES
ncbi:4Fe-4S ferredoxin [Solemya pervernicosa gill symbiont]|uniref:4Fe-4S ferredoxin n=2 Tax=Gammaproteobacteria incertae sedis TaxID=118884 RepID=A0A1T2LB89_9GAMM|nr:4Fe-4S binding protein [Candidatus Reidiella endopervernicosa]OOZ42365.1 4Fe-4S ferredoxin [Solemya pervernicosa gill symbiont]QKQ25758.1 4Fe-4S binding protein [Candidatus Reidiella endopervernicosa]